MIQQEKTITIGVTETAVVAEITIPGPASDMTLIDLMAWNILRRDGVAPVVRPGNVSKMITNGKDLMDTADLLALGTIGSAAAEIKGGKKCITLVIRMWSALYRIPI